MEAKDPNSKLSGLPLVLCVIALCLSAFLIVLDYTIANISIPNIAGTLGVSKEQGTYVITSFAVGNAVVLAISGWLARRAGSIRLILVSLLGFAFFSWICGMATTLPMLVGARFLQGVTSGPFLPLSQTLLSSIFVGERKHAAHAYWSSIVMIGPVVGPVLGGWITYDYTWPWIFYINIPICIFSVFVIFTFMRHKETSREKTPTDWVGLVLLLLAVSALQFLLDKGEQYNWMESVIIRTCVITSGLSFIYLIVWELFHKHPVLELHLFKYRSYAIGMFTIGLQYALYFGTVVLVPLWLQEFMGYTPVWAGLAVAPLMLAPIFFSWTIKRLLSRFGAYWLLVMSNVFYSLACFYASHGNTDVSLLWVSSGRFIFSFGLLFMIIPVFSLTVIEITQKHLTHAAGMFHFVRAMSGGIGTAIFTTLWIRRSAFHHANLAADVIPERPEVANFFHKMSLLNVKGKEAWAMMNEFVTRQGAMLGLNDCFYLMGWVFILLFAFLTLNYRKRFAK